MESFSLPERKDRADGYGGVILYVKQYLYYRRRRDLEINGVECLWIEIEVSNKHILFGTFYRPPNTDAFQHSLILDSIHLAFDTGIENIIIAGDFNLNIANQVSNKKVSSICDQFSLTQLIDTPTHFTETSSSIIDLIFTSNKNLIHISGVGDLFLPQNVRYHCPVYGLLNLKKAKFPPFYRHVWIFDKGNYDRLRQITLTFDWASLKHEDIDKYTENIANKIIENAKICIPNRKVLIREGEPSWFTNEIRLLIRKRKRYYRKARQRNTPYHWEKFRNLRNLIVNKIRVAKSQQLDLLSKKLKSESQTNKTWWSCLKSFIKPYSSSSIPPLSYYDKIIEDMPGKANLFNDFFVGQTRIDENSAPPLPHAQPVDHDLLVSITISPDEVISVLQSLQLGKAAGPDSINNRILRELSLELSGPLCDLFNYSLRISTVPNSWKNANVTPIFKSGDPSLVNNSHKYCQ
ncbi:uncharacterized protein LOC123525918 [Mercenaria mercenaria]|uniref:uncharacterized protein LOC123525918 n=1 Tax=Mercenaria mercenaria TaxID=6596 RepID=UPI001E1DE1F4|nr:uncharacterized protein LOC123525918 [Mercenaria mercenaria]